MNFNTKWDVDQYKTEHESDEHWQLRRSFMMTHKDKFSEERLVCLAQVFTNIEFLGCRYPAETMDLVEQLSEGVADAYREKQKTKLQRTFVKASDAAGAKVKGLKRPAAEAAGPSDTPSKISKCIDSSVQQDLSLSAKTITSDSTSCNNLVSIVCDQKKLDNNFSDNSSKLSLRIGTCSFVPASELSETSLREEKCNSNDINGCEQKSVHLSATEVNEKIVKRVVPIVKSNRHSRKLLKDGLKPESNRKLDAVSAGKFGRLVLLEMENETLANNILCRSTAGCQIPLRYEYEQTIMKTFCTVFVNGHLLTSSCGFNLKKAREIANKEAYEKLKQICYVLKIKSKIMSDGAVVNREHTDAVPTSQGNSLDKPLSENIGSKLMRSMGWTGGGLGKDQQGIQEPVSLSCQIKRSGFGLSQKGNLGKKPFYEKALSMLQEYSQNDSIHDLVFSSEFSKEERAVMHRIANKLHLKSQSYGKNEDRSLVISKKKNYCQIVENMLQSGQLSTAQYELIKPPISLPPVMQSQVEEHNSEMKFDNTTSVKTEAFNQNRGVTSELSVPKSLEDKKESCGHVDFLSSEAKSTPTASVFSVKEPNKVCHARQNDCDVNASPFGRLVLVEDENCSTPVQIIERSANGCHIPFKYEYANVRGGMICRLFVNNVLVTSATDCSKKRAREATVSSGIEKLKDVCCTLRTRFKMEGDSLSIIKRLQLPRNRGNSFGSNSEESIFCVSKQVDRTCLGIGGISVFKNKIRDFLRDYLTEGCPYELIFRTDFSSPERLFIQRTASGLALKTNMYVVSKNEFLVLSKKLTPVETAEAILRSGGNESANSFPSGNMVII